MYEAGSKSNGRLFLKSRWRSVYNYLLYKKKCDKRFFRLVYKVPNCRKCCSFFYIFFNVCFTLNDDYRDDGKIRTTRENKVPFFIEEISDENGRNVSRSLYKKRALDGTRVHKWFFRFEKATFHLKVHLIYGDL